MLMGERVCNASHRLGGNSSVLPSLTHALSAVGILIGTAPNYAIPSPRGARIDHGPAQGLVAAGACFSLARVPAPHAARSLWLEWPPFCHLCGVGERTPSRICMHLLASCSLLAHELLLVARSVRWSVLVPSGVHRILRILPTVLHRVLTVLADQLVSREVGHPFLPHLRV